jgi:hypothetical protein
MIEFEDIQRLVDEEFEHFKRTYTAGTAVQEWAEDNNITGEALIEVLGNLLGLVVPELKEATGDELSLGEFMKLIGHLNNTLFMSFVIGFKISEQYGRVRSDVE